MSWMMARLENNLLHNPLSTIHEAVLDCEIMNQNDTRLFHELHLRCQAVEPFLSHLHAFLLRYTCMLGINSNHR